MLAVPNVLRASAVEWLSAEMTGRRHALSEMVCAIFQRARHVSCQHSLVHGADVVSHQGCFAAPDHCTGWPKVRLLHRINTPCDVC